MCNHLYLLLFLVKSKLLNDLALRKCLLELHSSFSGKVETFKRSSVKEVLLIKSFFFPVSFVNFLVNF